MKKIKLKIEAGLGLAWCRLGYVRLGNMVYTKSNELKY